MVTRRYIPWAHVQGSRTDERHLPGTGLVASVRRQVVSPEAAKSWDSSARRQLGSSGSGCWTGRRDGQCALASTRPVRVHPNAPTSDASVRMAATVWIGPNNVSLNFTNDTVSIWAPQAPHCHWWGGAHLGDCEPTGARRGIRAKDWGRSRFAVVYPGRHRCGRRRSRNSYEHPSHVGK